MALLDVRKHATRRTQANHSRRDMARALAHFPELGAFVRALHVQASYIWQASTPFHFGELSIADCRRSLRGARLWANISETLTFLTISGLSALASLGHAVLKDSVRFEHLKYLAVSLLQSATLYKAGRYVLEFALTDILSRLSQRTFSLAQSQIVRKKTGPSTGEATSSLRASSSSCSSASSASCMHSCLAAHPASPSSSSSRTFLGLGRT